VAPRGEGDTSTVVAFAPGRVNLIGDHTDHAGGLALPMAIDLGTTVSGTRQGRAVHLTSDDVAGPAEVAVDVHDPASTQPSWARYVAGVVAELRPSIGLRGRVRTTLPIGAGLSSSAALEVACALALGADPEPLGLARLAQRAEHRATGVPTGLMDQLVATSGVEGHALLVDFADDTATAVPVPDGLEVVVVHSGEERALERTGYAERRHEVARAQEQVGSLRDRPVHDADGLGDRVLRRRARHVIAENARVVAMADALRRGDAGAAGSLMLESHASLRDDLDVSTPALDALVEALVAIDGVHGARLTGAGFGGCVVALTEPGALDPTSLTGRGWRVRPSGGARLLDD
jgi:galactokinase